MSFTYFPLTAQQVKNREIAWNGLAGRQAFGRAAISARPHPDAEEIRSCLTPEDQIPLAASAREMPEWDRDIRSQLVGLQINALSKYQDDTFPVIDIPRRYYGQSQSLAETMGCKLVMQDQSQALYHAEPWIESASDVDRIKPIPIENCKYQIAIDFMRYARERTEGQLAIRHPVMTGPIDTVNYVLGTTKLMEWIYEEPEALHKLLSLVTEMLIGTIKSFQRAADGAISPEPTRCLGKGFGLCSEVRHLISKEAYLEFESPYLRQIGRECGSYAFHSCGTWERMLDIDMQDPNLMMVNFQSKEMDLAKVYEITKGKLSLSFKMSGNLGEQYLWSDEESYFRYLMTVFPEPIPIEFEINNNETYESVKRELCGGISGMFQD